MFSACRRWRYEVARIWDPQAPRVAMVMLNPSTTDAVRVDPTVRRCLGFARAWGAGALSVTNCFAWRSPDPRVLRHVADPVGRDDDRFVIAAARAADLVVAAWGVGGELRGRGAEVQRLLADADVAVSVLGLTRDGHPAHPLYLPATAVPRRWSG